MTCFNCNRSSPSAKTKSAPGQRGVARSAVEAAGEIHTDIQRGFVRAEVVACDDLLSLGGMSEAKTKGKLRLEGKEYLVKDGDIMHIRFNI